MLFPSMRAFRFAAVTALLLLSRSCQVAEAAKFRRIKAALEFASDFVLQKHSLDFHGEMQGLTVIGAGFSRTGTKSIENALQSLGHRVYDMRSIFENGHVDQWVQAAIDWKEQDDLGRVKALLADMESKGYTATLDFPMNIFALAFAELRPDAKVLFSVRDTEEKWMESWAKTTHNFANFVCRPWSWIIPDMHFNRIILRTVLDFDWIFSQYPESIDRPLPWYEVTRKLVGMDGPEMQRSWINLHKRFQRMLEEALPEDRLLVFNVKQGWGPLVPFLEIEDRSLVEQDFPNMNDSASIQIVRTVMDVIAIGLPFWILVILYLTSRMLKWCFGSCFGASKTSKTKKA